MSSYIPFLFLLFAVFASFKSNLKNAMVATFFAVIAGVVAGRIYMVGLMWLLLLTMNLTAATSLSVANYARRMCYGGFVLVAVGLMLHMLPGFVNMKVLDQLKYASDSLPFTMYLNFDKTLVGVLLMVFFIHPNQTKPFGHLEIRFSLICLILLIAVMVPLATLSQYVRLDIKVPEQTWLWLLNNLFFVCVAEEAFFRGFIQGGLKKILPGNSAGVLASITIGAFLFGIAHFKGGMTYMAFSTLAGLFYGFAYQKTNRIEAPIFVHFGLNLVHYICFSYPALA